MFKQTMSDVDKGALKSIAREVATDVANKVAESKTSSGSGKHLESSNELDKIINKKISKAFETARGRGVGISKEVESNVKGMVADTGIHRVTTSYTDVVESTKDLVNSTGEAAVSVEKLVSSINNLKDGTGDISDLIDSLVKAVGSISSATKDLLDFKKDVQVAGKETSTFADPYIKKAKKVIDDPLKDVYSSFEDLNKETLDEFTKTLVKSIKSNKKIKKSVSRDTDLSNMFDNIMDYTEGKDVDFKEVARDSLKLFKKIESSYNKKTKKKQPGVKSRFRGSLPKGSGYDVVVDSPGWYASEGPKKRDSLMDDGADDKGKYSRDKLTEKYYRMDERSPTKRSKILNDTKIRKKIESFREKGRYSDEDWKKIVDEVIDKVHNKVMADLTSIDHGVSIRLGPPLRLYIDRAVDSVITKVLSASTTIGKQEESNDKVEKKVGSKKRIDKLIDYGQRQIRDHLDFFKKTKAYDGVDWEKVFGSVKNRIKDGILSEFSGVGGDSYEYNKPDVASYIARNVDTFIKETVSGISSGRTSEESKEGKGKKPKPPKKKTSSKKTRTPKQPPPDDDRCLAITSNGDRCKKPRVKNSSFCSIHKRQHETSGENVSSQGLGSSFGDKDISSVRSMVSTLGQAGVAGTKGALSAYGPSSGRDDFFNKDLPKKVKDYNDKIEKS